MSDVEKRAYANGQKGTDGSYPNDTPGVTTMSVEELNASGHADKLQRHYGLLSICATALTVDSAWIAL